MKISRGRLEPCNDNFGGIKSIFLFSYSPTVADQLTGRYGVSLISYPSTQVYEYEVVNASFTENRGEELGEWSQSLSVTLPIQTVVDAEELEKLIGIEIGVIILNRDGRYRLMGAFNGCNVTQYSTQSGGGGSDLNGYTISIEASERYKSPEIVNFALSGFFVGEVIIKAEDFLAAYKFNNNFIDSVGNNDGIGTGTAFNSSIKKAGSFSSEFLWTTTPDYLTIPYISASDDFNFSGNKPFSISMWFYPTEDKNFFLINKRETNFQPDTAEFRLLYNNNELALDLFDVGSSPTGILRGSLTGVTVNVNEWNNVVATTNGVDQVHIYFNGVKSTNIQEFNMFNSINSFAQPVIIGARAFALSDAAFGFKGYIDETYIFSKELSDLQALYILNQGLANQSLI